MWDKNQAIEKISLISYRKEVRIGFENKRNSAEFMKVFSKNVMKQKSSIKVSTISTRGSRFNCIKFHTEDLYSGRHRTIQFEVFQYRMLHEIQSEVIMTPIGKNCTLIKPEQLDTSIHLVPNFTCSRSFMNNFFLFENNLPINCFADKYPNVELNIVALT